MLIVALISTLAPLPLSKPAKAQLLPQYSVGVVDFVNESGVQGELLARLATDAVVVEMSKTNRYDVSITRTQMKTEMEKLDLHSPLSKTGLVRLGESLSADAMLEGSITSVQLAGSGVTRRASVTLVVQMVDQASGEIVNGAVQTGNSSARVGYTPDDDALMVEAINNAAFLAVKTMVDYIIPEATVQNSLGENQVMLNRGSRDGIATGMQMIVLRNKEIIGYLTVQGVSPQDSSAKITKSMRGIQPEDRARAIFEMPAIGGAASNESLPSGAPPQSKMKSKTLGKIAKFLLGAALVFGVVSLFKSGRGSEDSPSVGTGDADEVTWDAGVLNKNSKVWEYQVIRDTYSTSSTPVMTMRDSGEIDNRCKSVAGLFGSGDDITVDYYSLDMNPTENDPTSGSTTVAIEPYGTTHKYQVRVLYEMESLDDNTSDDTTSDDDDDDDDDDDNYTTKYYFTSVSNSVTITVIEPVLNEDVISPAYSSDEDAPELDLTELSSGDVNLQWNRKDGADVYYVVVEPVIPNAAPSWTNKSDPIYETSSTVELPTSQRIDLAETLSGTKYAGVIMKWTVYCQHEADTSDAWYKGDQNRFEIAESAPVKPSS